MQKFSAELLQVLVALAACSGGEVGGASDAPAAGGGTTATTAAAVDELAAFCARWDEVRAVVQSDNIDTSTSLDTLLEAARNGVELDNPTISSASQDIVDALTWVDKPEGTPAPDPALMSDGIIAIGFECDPVG